ncbi:hypothetical protein FRB99_002158, partial [Tulasnella sp. 403]
MTSRGFGEKVTVVEIRLPGATKKKKIMIEGGGLPVMSGRSSDVYYGHEGSIGRVALKRHRGTFVSYEKEIEEETKHWQSLDHEHVLPFLGIAYDGRKIPYLVSPWMDRGSLWEHIQDDPLCDRPRYLWEIASALVYLHEKDLVHGDITAYNILVSGSDHAKLADFGTSKLASMGTISSLKGAGPIRYQSPELWKGAGKTMKSDVYAFGMTIYQVLSGRLPFFDFLAESRIYIAVIEKNERPPCLPEIGPRGQSYKQLWVVAESCWKKVPAHRPTMREVHLMLPIPENRPTRTEPSSAAPSKHQRSPAPGTTPAQQLLHEVVSALPAIVVPSMLRGPPSFQSQLISRLAAISESRNLMSDVADLGGIIIFDSPSSISPHTTAGNSDIYRAVLPPSRIAVAIKVLHATSIKDTTQIDIVAKRLGRELRIWKALKHDRITPLLGYAILEIGACLISPWCENGNALEYLKNHQSVDRRRLVLQVAEGLVYLHKLEPPIVHADIKAPNNPLLEQCNVLINDDGDAMLCDFGISKLLEDAQSGFTTTDNQKGTYRFMAPEQFGEKPIYTTETDVYAFGCLAIEIMSGKAPFIKCTHEAGLVGAKIQGKLMEPADYPELPEDDSLWPLLRKCWAMAPDDRPSMIDVYDE